MSGFVRKYAKRIAVFLVLVFMFTGCAGKKFTVDESFNSNLPDYYIDVELMKSIEEDKNLLREKEEFLQWFEKYCGFSLPDYFVFPITNGQNGNDNGDHIRITKTRIFVDVTFIIEKNDAFEMLEHVINDDSFEAIFGRYWQMAVTQEEKEKSHYFHKSRGVCSYTDGETVSLYFYYNAEDDMYILRLAGDMYREGFFKGWLHNWIRSRPSEYSWHPMHNQQSEQSGDGQF